MGRSVKALLSLLLVCVYLTSSGCGNDGTFQDYAASSAARSATKSIYLSEGLGATNVLFKDDFNDNSLDSTKWIPHENIVLEQDGMMQVMTNETDHGGWLESYPITINSKYPLIISRKVNVHYANSHFGGSMRIKPLGIEIKYGHMDYTGYPSYCSYDGFYVIRNGASIDYCTQRVDVSSATEAIWDTWFEEKVIYHPTTGLLEYFINGQKRIDFNVGILPSTVSQINLEFNAWGWWTDHYQNFDDLVVEQVKSQQYTVPVDGLKLSQNPVDPGTYFNPYESATWFSMVWTGRYSGDAQERGVGTGGYPGLDILPRTGGSRNIRAIGDAKVIEKQSLKGYGNYIILEHKDDLLYGTFYSCYLHLDSFKVQKGDNVSKGDLIGIMGDTGGQKEVHLHFQLDKTLHPFFDKKGNFLYYIPYWPEYSSVDKKGNVSMQPYPQGDDSYLTSEQLLEAAENVENNTINPMILIDEVVGKWLVKTRNDNFVLSSTSNNITYYYDNDGNIAGTITETSGMTGYDKFRNAYFYDDVGRLIKVIIYQTTNDIENPWAEITYTYDSYGRKATETLYYIGATYSTTTWYDYDEYGSVIKLVAELPDGVNPENIVKSVTIYSYKYDKFKLPYEKTGSTLSDDNLIMQTITEYTYDDSYLLTSEITTYLALGQISCTYYYYDTNNNLTQTQMGVMNGTEFQPTLITTYTWTQL